MLGKGEIRDVVKKHLFALRSQVRGLEGIVIDSDILVSSPGILRKWDGRVVCAAVLGTGWGARVAVFFSVRNEAWSRLNRMVAHQSGSWHWRDCNPDATVTEAIRRAAYNGVVSSLGDVIFCSFSRPPARPCRVGTEELCEAPWNRVPTLEVPFTAIDWAPLLQMTRGT